MEILHKYKNGDTEVVIYEDGTKERYYSKPWGEKISIDFPESIDLKISNYCNMGCKYCHEKSTKQGLHGDLDEVLSILDAANLPPGIELALGGGNPLDHTELKPFLIELKNRGFISNITINQGHLKTYLPLISEIIKEDLVKGVGISLTNDNYTYIKKVIAITPHVVIHVIVGVNRPSDLFKLAIDSEIRKLKFLILGYKTFGFGEKYLSKKSKEISNIFSSWKNTLGFLVTLFHCSFDNLAIEQLLLKNLLPEDKWSALYMGDDFTFTMYMDGVSQTYAPTSRSVERVSFKDSTLLEFFSTRKEI